MKSILITGCNRGLGLAFVKHLAQAKTPPKHIISTCRDKANAKTLNELSDNYSNVHIIQIDVNNFKDYSKLVEDVGKIVGEDGLNVLVNNAGISSRFTRVGLVKPQQMLDNFVTNTVAPLMLTKSLLPLLKAASTKNSSLPLGVSRAAVINISSILGSIEGNDVGGFYPYRCSKSALNAMTKSLSIDLKDDEIMVVSIHPGWCKTDMGGPNAPLPVDVAIPQLLKTLNGLTKEVNGCFIQYDGSSLPW